MEPIVQIHGFQILTTKSAWDNVRQQQLPAPSEKKEYCRDEQGVQMRKHQFAITMTIISKKSEYIDIIYK